MGRRWLAGSLAALLLACGGEGSVASGTGGSGAGGEGGDELPGEIEAGLLDFPCAAGELELADGACQPAGIPDDACPDGFAPDGARGCLPVLPRAACGPGTMAIPGETTCRPVAPCGSTPWEGIPVDADTQYVDAAFVGVSDGSAAAPWTTIPEAVGAALPGAVVAIAPGTYGGVTLIDKPVKLWGSCPDEVELVPEPGLITVAVYAGADGSELHRLSLSGISTLLSVVDVDDVVLDECWLHDSEYIGVYAYANAGETAGVAVRRSLLENLVGWGALSWASTLVVEDSVVRDVAADVEGFNGSGVIGYRDDAASQRPEVTVRGSLVERVRFAGIRSDGDLTVTRSAVRDVEPALVNDGEGAGIWSKGSADHPVDVVLEGVSVQRTNWMGALVVDGALDASRVTVRDVDTPSGNLAAIGLAAVDLDGVDGAEATLSMISVEDVDDIGMSVSGVPATLRGIAVADVRATSDELSSLGLGISLEFAGEGMPPPIDVRGIVVEQTQTFGLLVVGSDVQAESVWVRDVDPNEVSGKFGRGIGCELDALDPVSRPSLVLRHARVERTHEAGLTVMGGDADVTSLWVSDVVPPPVGSIPDTPAISAGALLQISLEHDIAGSAVVRDSLIEDVAMVGVAVTAIPATLERTIVRDIAAVPGVGLGDGVDAIGVVEPIFGVTAADVTLSSVRVERAVRAGFGLFASDGVIENSRFLCNEIALNGETFSDRAYGLVDAGGNACGCGEAFQDCKVISSSLEPPSTVGSGSEGM